MEYAFDDSALSIVAKGLNKQADYKQLHLRSLNYKHVFDPSVSMMRGNNTDGSWFAPFNADNREPYITEGTPRQYSFYVPHDVPGLAKLMGGTKMLENALDSLFAKNEYWHGNEPGHQIPFMYNYTLSPWKTPKEVRKILQKEYSDGPGGLSGNDDAGQMSAWHVFAAMGFYPVDPVSNNYFLCSPIFDEVVLLLQNNKKFELRKHKIKETALYVQQVKWNGRLYNKNYITYSMNLQGGKLEMWLTDEPTQWGASPASRPAGLTNYTIILMLKLETYFVVLFSSITICTVAQQNRQKVFAVKEFGAVGNGKTDDADAIQKTINACNAAGGGIVLFTAPFVYMASPFNIKSNIEMVLRSEELAREPGRDAAFLAGLREKLAAEPVVLAPMTSVPRERARQPWLLPAAAAAGFVAVAGVLVVLRLGTPGAPVPAAVLARAPGPGFTAVSNAAAPAAPAALLPADSAGFIRDPRLNEYLRAHQAAGGGVAAAAPGGTLRQVDVVVPGAGGPR